MSYEIAKIPEPSRRDDFFVDAAFITGSRAYGTPRPDSDLDVVAHVNDTAYDILKVASDADPKTQAAFEANKDAYPGEPRSLRFGRLNLICVRSSAEWDAWHKATRELRAKAPVTRDQACKHVQAALKEAL